LAAEKSRRKQRQRHLIVVAVLLCLGVGSSAAVGFTDAGQIDIDATIKEKNARIASGQSDERDINDRTLTVPVKNTMSQQVDGGLVGLGDTRQTAPPSEPATTTATSTEMGTTTDATSATSSDETATSTSADAEVLTDPDSSLESEENAADGEGREPEVSAEATEPEPGVTDTEAVTP
jgi:type 1 fimbria pilin